MRRRLLLSSLIVSLVSVLLLCLPLGLVAGSLIRQDFDHRLDRNLQNAAAAIIELSAQGRPVHASDLAALVPAARRAIYVPDRGPTVTAGHVTGPVQTDQKRLPAGNLQMQVPLRLLHQRLLEIWLLIAGLGVLAIAVAAGLSIWIANRLSRPLQALAVTAENFGRGDLRPSGRRYGIAELDQLADVLDRSAVRLGAVLDDERRFARETSHQLRTPLTSLSVRLEEIRNASDDPHIRSEADAGLQQIERLTEVVSSALNRSPGAAGAQPVNIHDVLRSQEREWEPAFRRQARRLIVDSPSVLHVRATSGGLEQAVSTLIENALSHGGGTTTVTVRQLSRHVSIDVSDDGPGVPEHLGQRIFSRDISGGSSTGLGLPLARAIVEAEGGRLELTGQGPTRFTIFIPTVDPAGESS